MPSGKILGLWRGLPASAAVAFGVRAVAAQSGLAEQATESLQELPGATLRVLRDAGAADCPDARQLGDSVRLQMRVQAERNPKTVVTVDVERQTQDYVGHINVQGRDTGERVLRVPGTDCAGLKDALVVTLGLILDEEPEPQAAPVPEIPRQPQIPPPNALPRVPDNRALALGFGAALTHGLPQDISVALRGNLELSSGDWSTAIGALWTPKKQVRFEPGTIDLQLWGGQAHFCRFFGLGGTKTPARALCAEGIVGKLMGHGHGYSSSQPQERPWVALGASASLVSRIDLRLGWAIRAVVTFPLQRDAFGVEGLSGEAYRMPGASLGLEALLRWRIL